MPAAKPRSPASPPDSCVRGRRLRGRRLVLPALALASGLLLRVQNLDDRVDRFRLGEIDSALESGLDQAANDLGSADRFAVFQPDVDGQSIEIGNMTVEKDDRDLR